MEHDVVKRKDYKLLVDPQIKKGEEKLLRYDGDSYNTENHGQGVVVLRDPRPRMNRLWSRRERAELPVPRYKVDEWYVGAVPPREVTFSRLNDNITRQFMDKMCLKFGKLERVRVYHHPKTQKHMGLSKVVFSSIKAASECVRKLHMTSVMGNVIHAQIDCKGEILNKLYQRIAKGEMMAETIPDVIRHTQEGITMSNKYKVHHHQTKKERRKSSQDDPRKSRRSSDARQRADDESIRPHHDAGEPEGKSEDIMENNRRRTEEKVEIASRQPQSEISFRIEDNMDRVSSRSRLDDNRKYSEFSDGHSSKGSVDEDTSNLNKGHHVWSSDLESRINLLLSEQTKKYKLDEVSSHEDIANNAKLRNDELRNINMDVSLSSKHRTGEKIHKKREKSHESRKSRATESMETENRKPEDISRGKPFASNEHQRNIDVSPDTPYHQNSLSLSPGRPLTPPMPFRARDPPADLIYARHDMNFEPNHRKDLHGSRSPRRSSPVYHERHHRFPGSQTDRRRYSPYHPRHHSPRHHSPKYERHRRMKQDYQERVHVDRGYDDSFVYREDPHLPPQHPDFYYRRCRSPARMPHSPQRQRHNSSERWMSPPCYVDRIPKSHHQHPGPARLSYRRRSTSCEQSPRFGRHMAECNRRDERPARTMQDTHFAPELMNFSDKGREDVAHDRQSRSPDMRDARCRDSYEASRSGRFSPSTSRRNSTNQETPKLSLEQRLKEMTGEVLPTDVNREKNITQYQKEEVEVAEKTLSRSDSSSVDMEISEGESDGEKMARLNLTNNVLKSEIVGNETWQNFRKVPWNGYGHGPEMVTHANAGMWDPAQDHFFKGFSRDPLRFPHHFHPPSQFPPEQWTDRLHPGIRHTNVHPYNIRPNMFPPSLGYSNFESDPTHSETLSKEDIEKRIEDHKLSQNVLDDVVQDLKAIVSRDLNRKVIETMAFKVYESWWDENEDKRKVANKAILPSLLMDNSNIISENLTTEMTNSNEEFKPGITAINKASKNLLNTFDPLNWAKNSFEMDGFRVGLGLRSAISKMPSFRVKRPRTPTPPPPDPDKNASVKKLRRLHNKENEGNELIKQHSKNKRYSHGRFSELDSEGEDADDNSDDAESEISSVDGERKIEKYSVLDVDDIFSESSESSEDSEESESENSESDNNSIPEVPVKKGSDVRKRKILVSEADDEEATLKESPSYKKSPRLEYKLAESEKLTPNLDRDKPINFPITPGSDNAMAISLLSPTAPSITGNILTPQQLRHVHPKKRHRLISQDHANFETTAKVSDKLRSDDELSCISDKERTALEALADMQMTPDRRLSSQSSDSSLLPGASSPSSPTKSNTKGPPPNGQNKLITACDTGSNQEAAAAAALLSIRKSTTSETKPMLVTPRRVNSYQHEDKVQMAELAEEHNYFVPSCSPRHVHPSMDPVLAQIIEEHSYSHPFFEHGLLPHNEHQKGFCTPESVSTMSADSIFKFEDEHLVGSKMMSAAERVKLRREQPDKSFRKRASKKEGWRGEKREVLVTPRELDQERVILYEMWHSGLDVEDMKYLREVYEGYLEKSHSPPWVNDSHWVPHPVTNVPDPIKMQRKKKRGKKDEVAFHKTGSARTEGFYQLEAKAKLKQRRLMYGQGKTEESATSDREAGFNNNTELPMGAQNSDKILGSRETRHFMRRIASEVGADVGDSFKYNQLMFRKKAVKFKRSSIHGWGLFAQEAIGADEMVIEYVGQVVRTLVAERREVHYTELGIGSSYLFRIDSDHIIDATKCGNYARFMNHSCNPSCYAKVITVDTAKKIVIYSKGPIKKSDEITYDYKFPLEDDKIMCHCGAENCRRTLN